MWGLVWLLALLAALAGCGKASEQKAAGPVEAVGPAVPQVLRLDEVMELPKEALALYSAYFLPGGDYLLYGDYALPEGRQGLLFRMSAADEVQQLCIWPEREFFEYTDYLQPYFLEQPGLCVLNNQTRHKFLIYSTADGSTQEAAAPAQLNLTDEDIAFWLAEGRLLLLRLQADPKEPQRVNTQVSIYDEAAGAEQVLAEFSGGLGCYLPPDEEHASWLLLSSWGDLLELTFPADGQPQVRRRSCPEDWPTPQPWLYYYDMQRVRQADGDYLALQVSCEDGVYYQVVDLQGGEIGFCPSTDENGGGLLAAQGGKLYFSEYYVQQEDYCRIFAWDFADGGREQLLGTAAAGLQADDLWGLGSGALRPDGGRLLMLSWGNIISLPLSE